MLSVSSIKGSHNRILRGRFPSPSSQIDPNELMQALKQERTAKAILSKDGVDRGQKQQRSKNTSSSSSSGDDVDKKKLVGDAQSPEKATPKPSPGEDGHSDSTSEAEQIAELGGGQTAVMAGEKRPEKEERPLFSLAEVESLTAYLVESQQAASLVNVADIQHGESVGIASLWRWSGAWRTSFAELEWDWAEFKGCTAHTARRSRMRLGRVYGMLAIRVTS